MKVNASNGDEVIAAIDSFRFELESIVLNVMRESSHYNLNVTIALCTPTLIGTDYRYVVIFI